MLNLRFERWRKLLDDDKFYRLSKAHVVVFGLGGVGGYAVEMLARAGIGHLTLIDGDKIDITNCNRQLIALESTIGLNKAECWKARCIEINPDIKIDIHCAFLRTREEICSILNGNFSAAIEAIDEINPKLEFILAARHRKIPCISSMGAGGKYSIEKIQIADISKTYGCPLARSVRTKLRTMGVVKGVTVAFSPEIPLRRCEGAIGSFACVPAVFGITCAQWVVMRLLDN